MRTSSAVPMLCVFLATGTVMATVIVLMTLMSKIVLPLLVQTQSSYVNKKIVALKRQNFATATEIVVMAQMKLLHVVSITISIVLIYIIYRF